MSDFDISIKFGEEGDTAIKAANALTVDWLGVHAVDAGHRFEVEEFALRPLGREGWLSDRDDQLPLALCPIAERKARRRHGGLGSALIERAEALARAKDCVGMWLDTYTYQAPDFYPRHGFEEFGRIKDFRQDMIGCSSKSGSDNSHRGAKPTARTKIGPG